MKKRIILFLVAIFTVCATCTSCFTTMALLAASDGSSSSNISNERAYLSLKIIQTLSKNEALAWTEKYDVVKIETASDVYYDGKQIKGYFTLIDTYTYETNKGVIKTVPVYVLTSELKKYPNVWK